MQQQISLRRGELVGRIAGVAIDQHPQRFSLRQLAQIDGVRKLRKPPGVGAGGDAQSVPRHRIPVLDDDSPMFEELHIQQTCPWPMNVPGGWWPDVLPKAGSEKDPEDCKGYRDCAGQATVFVLAVL